MFYSIIFLFVYLLFLYIFALFLMNIVKRMRKDKIWMTMNLMFNINRDSMENTG